MSLEAMLGGGAQIRKFLSNHRDCRMLGMPSLQCTAPGCDATGFGRDTRCQGHGGKMEDARL
jgi:hypothetical protein